MKERRFGPILVALLMAFLAVPGTLACPQQDPSHSSRPESDTSKSDAKESDYAGPEACKTCYEDIYKGWEKSPHGRESQKRLQVSLDYVGVFETDYFLAENARAIVDHGGGQPDDAAEFLFHIV
jgi:hypothetical protein